MLSAMPRTKRHQKSKHGTRVKLVCAQCGESFEVIPSIAHKRTHCSQECHNEGRRKYPKTRKCLGCGEIYAPPAMKLGRSRYCSSECVCTSRRTAKVYSCAWCGKMVEREPSRVGKVVLCSNECKHKYYSGERHPCYTGVLDRWGYPPEFNEGFKQEVRTLDFNKCVMCAVGHDLCIHHIDGDKLNTVAENCVTLCRHCHAFVHAFAPKEYTVYADWYYRWTDVRVGIGQL